MSALPNTNRYPPSVIGLHWLTLVLLVGVYTLIELREIYPKGSDLRELMKTWHFMLGLTVLAVTVLRLALRARVRVGPLPPAWQQGLAKFGHLVLYLFLIAMPLLGWVTLSLKGKPIPFFGLELPALLGPDEALAKRCQKIHANLGTLGYVLIGLHALAALYHHHVLRDDSLLRMLPARHAARVAARRDA